MNKLLTIFALTLLCSCATNKPTAEGATTCPYLKGVEDGKKSCQSSHNSDKKGCNEEKGCACGK